MTIDDAQLTPTPHPPSQNQTGQGTLYGVGLGPGAADLMTLRAARLIENASVIAYPTLVIVLRDLLPPN